MRRKISTALAALIGCGFALTATSAQQSCGVDRSGMMIGGSPEAPGRIRVYGDCHDPMFLGLCFERTTGGDPHSILFIYTGKDCGVKKLHVKGNWQDSTGQHQAVTMDEVAGVVYEETLAAAPADDGHAEMEDLSVETF